MHIQLTSTQIYLQCFKHARLFVLLICKTNFIILSLFRDCLTIPMFIFFCCFSIFQFMLLSLILLVSFQPIRAKGSLLLTVGVRGTALSLTIHGVDIKHMRYRGVRISPPIRSVYWVCYIESVMKTNYVLFAGQDYSCTGWKGDLSQSRRYFHSKIFWCALRQPVVVFCIVFHNSHPPSPKFSVLHCTAKGYCISVLHCDLTPWKQPMWWLWGQNKIWASKFWVTVIKKKVIFPAPPQLKFVHLHTVMGVSDLPLLLCHSHVLCQALVSKQLVFCLSYAFW